jgi:thiamine-phosphate pyrophosphorylase
VKPIVCLITDRRRLADPGPEAVLRQVRRAAADGIQLVQIRERDLDARALYDLCQRAVDSVRGTATRVIVNDRLDIALAARAHGVQLRGSSFPVARVRPVVPQGFLIGQSVHSAEEAAAARAADFLLFGTVFATASKPGLSPAGLQALAAAVRSTAVPVLAVGGVSAVNIPHLIEAGAAGFAAITMFETLSGA